MSKNRDGFLRGAWHHFLDGARPWGSIDVCRDRFGVTRYRLVVYPPGISDAERRRVRVARGWPLWCLALWLVAHIYLSNVLDPWTALAVSISFTLVLGWAAVTLAGPLRTQVRTMTAAVLVGYPDLGSIADRDKIQRLGARLIRADENLADGGVTAIEHEAIWWSVYDEIARDRPAGTPGLQESDRSAL